MSQHFLPSAQFRGLESLTLGSWAAMDVHLPSSTACGEWCYLLQSTWSSLLTLSLRLQLPVAPYEVGPRRESSRAESEKRLSGTTCRAAAARRREMSGGTPPVPWSLNFPNRKESIFNSIQETSSSEGMLPVSTIIWVC